MKISSTDLQIPKIESFDIAIAALEERIANLPINLHDVITHSENLHIRKDVAHQICILKIQLSVFIALS